MNGNFFDGLDELYHHAKFEEDRTTRGGWDENVVFVTMFIFFLPRSESGAPCVPGVHSSFTSIALPFIARFRRGFQRFFHNGLLFQKHYLVRIFIARCRHYFREISVQNCEKSKITRI